MKKLSLFLVFILLTGITPCVNAAESMENFKTTSSYTQNFTDVPLSSWYAENVATVYELGLVNGKSETEFVPEGNVTIAESITLAVRIHNTYHGTNHAFSSSTPWYQSYVDYAVSNGMITSNQFKNYDALATRSDFALIMAKSLPEKEFNIINNVVHGNIPDIYAYMPCAESVYMLYNAGILSGSDEYGIFLPHSNIKRSEVAAIIARIALRNQRKEFILKATDGNRRVEEMVCIKKDAPQNIANTYINPKTGEETQSDNYLSATEYFEIDNTDTIFAQIKNAAMYFPNIVFYDSNKNFISGDVKIATPEERMAYKHFKGVFYKVPENAKYIRYCYGSGLHNSNLEIYIINHKKDPVKPFEGTKILNLGDSLFAITRVNNISSFLSEISGATVYNGAFGGTRIVPEARHGAYQWFDGLNLIKALTTQDWSSLEANVSNVPTKYFPDTLAMLQRLDMSDIDIVTLNWGTGDYTGFFPINEVIDAYMQILGMLKFTYPHLKIVVLSPTWRYFTNTDSDSKMYLDYTLRQLTEEIIKAAQKCGVYYINCYDELPLSWETKDLYFAANDSAHLNEKGNALYAELIYNELKKIYNVE